MKTVNLQLNSKPFFELTITNRFQPNHVGRQQALIKVSVVICTTTSVADETVYKNIRVTTATMTDHVRLTRILVTEETLGFSQEHRVWFIGLDATDGYDGLHQLLTVQSNINSHQVINGFMRLLNPQKIVVVHTTTTANPLHVLVVYGFIVAVVVS